MNSSSTKVVTDILFDLLFSVLVLFFLFFLMVKIQREGETNDAKSDSNFLVCMRWEKNNDIDLWLKLPNGQRVGYPSRDKPPAHLDVDVVALRKYVDSTGEHVISPSEEIVSIRGILPGEYVVNAHYFSPGWDPGPTEVEIFIQDVKNRQVLFVGKRTIQNAGDEVHFVKFRVDRTTNGGYMVGGVHTDRPEYFLRLPNLEGQIPEPTR